MEAIGPPTAGSESPARDAEILEMLATLLDRLGIQNWTLELNSVGCEHDRPKFNEALRAALKDVVGKMCSDCQRRAETNPLRVFDCKVPADQPIIATLPRISQFLDEGCRKHFADVQAILTTTGVPFQLNDRLVLALKENEAAAGAVRPPDVYIAPLGAGMDKEAARLARELRRHDLVVELGDESFRLKKSLETASKLGARYCLIVGENEVASEQFALKNLATGEQVTVPRADLAQRLQAQG